MFSTLRKKICFFICTVALASNANKDVKINAGLGCKAASITLGTLSTMCGLINLLQASGSDVFVNETDGNSKVRKEEGIFGLYGPVGKWIGRPYSGEIRGKKIVSIVDGKQYYSYDDSQETGKLAPVVIGIGKITLGIGGIVLGVLD